MALKKTHSITQETILIWLWYGSDMTMIWRRYDTDLMLVERFFRMILNMPQNSLLLIWHFICHLIWHWYDTDMTLIWHWFYAIFEKICAGKDEPDSVYIWNYFKTSAVIGFDFWISYISILRSKPSHCIPFIFYTERAWSRFLQLLGFCEKESILSNKWCFVARALLGKFAKAQLLLLLLLLGQGHIK